MSIAPDYFAMTDIRITSERTKRSEHAIFVSAGDRETFATLALDRYSDFFDVIIFFYGANTAKKETLSDGATLFAEGSGTKFNALKELYRQRPDLISRYKTMWVCDDDITPEFGDVRVLPAAAELFGVKLLSPAHSRLGKISHPIMMPRAGLHFFRYTSFVETTCPLFKTDALEAFLKVFDASLTSYGTDWWYLQTLGIAGDEDSVNSCAVVDAVTIVNPHDHMKPGGYREIEQVEPVSARRERWNRRRRELGLKEEWTPRNRGLVAFRPKDLQSARYQSGWFKRSGWSQLQILFNDFNYFIRFYRARKRINGYLGRSLV